MQWQTILAFSLLLTVPNVISQDEPNFNKKNVVIFFTKPDIEVSNDIDDSGISFLQFPVNGQVEAMDHIPKQYQNLFSIDPQDRNCNSIFNNYLMDLIDWATNSRHMVTATVTSTDTDICSVVERQYMDADNYHRYEMYKYSINEPINMNTDNFGYIPAELGDSDRSVRDQEYFLQLPLETPSRDVKNLPTLTFDNVMDNIAIINADNPVQTNEDRDREGAFYRNDDAAYRRNTPSKKRNRELKALLQYAPHRKLIRKSDLNSESNDYRDLDYRPRWLEYKKDRNHWEHFNEENNNRNKEKATNEEKISDEVSDLEKERIKKQTSDLINAFGFGFFSTIRDVFANSFLNPTDKRDAKSLENNIDLSILGTVHPHTMFDLVKSTFKNVQTYVANHRVTTRGFLLVVIGGNISETGNPFSDLVQSTKYVLEHTDRTETLVLVTCYCPSRGLGNQKKRSVPYYAHGLDSLELQNSANMWDIFNKMKTMIGSKIQTLTKKTNPAEILDKPITDDDAPNKNYTTGLRLAKRRNFFVNYDKESENVLAHIRKSRSASGNMKVITNYNITFLMVFFVRIFRS